MTLPLRNAFWTLLAVLAIALSLSGQLDRLGEVEAAAGFKRALVTFALARALNAAISVAQGTELALEPAGVGVVLSVGQVLDPINDLVEQFSTVMLIASTSLGLQNVLLKITSARGFDVALVVAAFAVVLSCWLPWQRAQTAAPWARRLLLAMIFIRFALPVLIIGSNAVFETFLASEQAAAVSALEGVQADIREINESPRTVRNPDASFRERLGYMVDDTLASIDPRPSLERLSQRMAGAAEHIINLIVIFVLQTILLPLAFVWLFMEILKGIGRRLAGNGS